KFTKPITNFGNSVGEFFLELRKKVEKSSFYDEKLAGKLVQKALDNLTESQLNELFDKSLKQLSAKRVINSNGDYFTRETLKKAWKEASDGDILGYILEGGVMIPVVKQNGAIGISGIGLYQTVELQEKTWNLYTNQIRTQNLDEAAELFRLKWIKNMDEMPESIAKELQNLFPDRDLNEII